MGSLKEELKRFCQMTSMKGVPRAIRPQSLILKIIWIVSVVSFLVIAGYQTRNLINQYFSYGTVIVLTEKIIDFPSAPDVIMCNLKPLSSMRLTPNVPSISEYYFHVDNITNSAAKDDLKDVAWFRDLLLSPTGYYQFIGKAAAVSSSHHEDDTIVDCHVALLDGAGETKVPCKGNVNITHHVSSTFFNCYKIHINHKEANGISVLSYVDDFVTEDDVRLLYTGLDMILKTGLVVSLVEHHTLWTSVNGDILLSPGTINQIQLRLQKRDSLQPPHGECQNDGYNAEKYRTTYRRTASVCISMCYETGVAEQCSCKDMRSFNILDDQNMMPNMTYCGDVNLPFDELFNNLDCAYLARQNLTSHCRKACPPKCSRNIYTNSMTSIPWHPQQNIEVFYAKYIQGRRYETHFKSAWVELKANASKTKLADLITKNFLQFTIFPGEYSYIHLEEKLSSTVTSLFAQLGGTLNLYSGITAVLFIEVVEFFIRLLTNEGKKEKITTVVSPTETKKGDAVHDLSAKKWQSST